MRGGPMALEAHLDEQNRLGRFHGAALVRRGSQILASKDGSLSLPVCDSLSIQAIYQARREAV